MFFVSGFARSASRDFPVRSHLGSQTRPRPHGRGAFWTTCGLRRCRTFVVRRVFWSACATEHARAAPRLLMRSTTHGTHDESESQLPDRRTRDTCIIIHLYIYTHAQERYDREERSDKR
jgi:hypothetical protein